jgi:hypothetical protein
MKLIFLLILYFIISSLLISCSNEKISIEIKPPYDGAPKKGYLYINNNKYDIDYNSSSNINIVEDKNYKIVYEDENKDVFGYIESIFVNYKDKIILTLNHNNSFRKIDHLIPSSANFNCYLYDDYNFYIFRKNSIEKYSLINSSAKKLKKIDLENNCINIDGKLIFDSKKIYFINNEKIDSFIYEKNIQNFYFKSLNSEKYILITINNEKIDSIVFDISSKSSNIFTDNLVGFENKNIDILYINNQIILWQNSKLYKLVNNKFSFYHNFDKEGRVFQIKDKIFLFSENKIFKIEDKIITDLNLSINLNDYNITTLENSLLITSNHIKNESNYYIFNGKKISSFTVKRSEINIKDFNSVKIDKYQYLFFNKDSFDSISRSIFYLFSNFDGFFIN